MEPDVPLRPCGAPLRASAAVLRLHASLQPQYRQIELYPRLKAEILDSLHLLGEGRVVDWQEMQP